MIQTTEHTIIGALQLYVGNQELWHIELCHLDVAKSDTNLSCTALTAKYVCFPAEVNTQRRISLDHTP